jgi:L-amino acid N-acyltransferase
MICFLIFEIIYKKMSIEIRHYKDQDIENIVEIINYNILNSSALYDYHVRTVEQQKQIFHDKLHKNFPIIVATLDQEVVGFGYYSEFRFREAYRYTVEHSVYVSNQQQGKGIGKLLLEKLIELAKDQKMHTMIGVIDSENENSILFHESFGFEKVGIIKESGFKFDRWLHSVIMQLMLE